MPPSACSKRTSAHLDFVAYCYLWKAVEAEPLPLPGVYSMCRCSRGNNIFLGACSLTNCLGGVLDMNAVERTLLHFAGGLNTFDRSRLSSKPIIETPIGATILPGRWPKNAFSLAINSSNSLLATFMAAFVATIVGFPPTVDGLVRVRAADDGRAFPLVARVAPSGAVVERVGSLSGDDSFCNNMRKNGHGWFTHTNFLSNIGFSALAIVRFCFCFLFCLFVAYILGTTPRPLSLVGHC